MSSTEDIVRDLEAKRLLESRMEQKSRGSWGETHQSRVHAEARHAFDAAIDIVKRHAPPESMNGWATGGADSYETDSLRCRIEDLEADLAARDRTIAEQAEALEGYRKLIVEEDTEALDGTHYWQVHSLSPFLPAHEIAALRERGVEVGTNDQEENDDTNN